MATKVKTTKISWKNINVALDRAGYPQLHKDLMKDALGYDERYPNKLFTVSKVQKLMKLNKEFPVTNLFMDTGAGKTMTCLNDIIKNFPNHNILIVTPKSLKDLQQWGNVIKTTELKNNKILNLTSGELVAMIDYVDNKEVVVNRKRMEEIKKFVAEPTVMIVDECQNMINSSNEIVKRVYLLMNYVYHTYMLTATFFESSPDQIWNLIRYSDVYMSKQLFQDSFCEFEDVDGNYINIWTGNVNYTKTKKRVVSGWKNLDKLAEYLIYVVKYLDVSVVQREMKKLGIKQHDYLIPYQVKGNDSVGVLPIHNFINDILNSSNVVRTLEEIKGEKNEYIDTVEIGKNSSKPQALNELLKKLGKRQVIIYYNYDLELAYLKGNLEQTYCEYNGHKKEIDKFLSGEAQVLLGHIKSASAGIDGLQHKCNVIIYYSTPFSLTNYIQSRGRIWRRNSTRDPHYFRFNCDNDESSKINARLNDKFNNMKNLFELIDRKQLYTSDSPLVSIRKYWKCNHMIRLHMIEKHALKSKA